MYKNNIFLDAESIRNKLFHWTGPPVQDSKERSEFDMLFLISYCFGHWDVYVVVWIPEMP